MNKIKLLLFNGSPRKNGTSYSFAMTIKKLAEDAGNRAEIVHIIDYFDKKHCLDDLRSKISQADIMALVAPLYVDTLPYPNIWLLEKLAGEFRNELRGKSLFAVAQSGFLDIKVLQPLLATCKFFAQETEMDWLGGLAYGGGSVINGAMMETIGKKGERITQSFKFALADIIAGKPISAKAQETLTEKIPKILYRPLAAYMNYTIKKTAKEKGISYEELTHKAYL